MRASGRQTRAISRNASVRFSANTAAAVSSRDGEARWPGGRAWGKTIEKGRMNQTEPHKPWHVEVAEFRVRNVIKVRRIRQDYIDRFIGDMGQMPCITASHVPGTRLPRRHLAKTSLHGRLGGLPQ